MVTDTDGDRGRILGIELSRIAARYRFAGSVLRKEVELGEPSSDFGTATAYTALLRTSRTTKARRAFTSRSPRASGSVSVSGAVSSHRSHRITPRPPSRNAPRRRKASSPRETEPDSTERTEADGALSTSDKTDRLMISGGLLESTSVLCDRSPITYARFGSVRSILPPLLDHLLDSHWC